MKSKLQKLLRALFTYGLRLVEENCSHLKNNASFSLTFFRFLRYARDVRGGCENVAAARNARSFQPPRGPPPPKRKQ